MLQQEKKFMKIQHLKPPPLVFNSMAKMKPAEYEKKIQELNEKKFFDRYEELKYEKIEDVKQFIPYKVGDQLDKFSGHKNPDMSFCSFILALSMCIVSIWVFYTDRDFNNEYFTRKILYDRLTKNPYGFIDYEEISTPDDLYQYLTTTFALQVFEDENPDDDRYIFNAQGLVPVGKVRIRQQRRMEIDCGDNTKVINLREE